MASAGRLGLTTVRRRATVALRRAAVSCSRHRGHDERIRGLSRAIRGAWRRVEAEPTGVVRGERSAAVLAKPVMADVLCAVPCGTFTVRSTSKQPALVWRGAPADLVAAHGTNMNEPAPRITVGVAANGVRRDRPRRGRAIVVLTSPVEDHPGSVMDRAGIVVVARSASAERHDNREAPVGSSHRPIFNRTHARSARPKIIPVRSSSDLADSQGSAAGGSSTRFDSRRAPAPAHERSPSKRGIHLG
jgi:hypothetical protein